MIGATDPVVGTGTRVAADSSAASGLLLRAAEAPDSLHAAQGVGTTVSSTSPVGAWFGHGAEPLRSAVDALGNSGIGLPHTCADAADSLRTAADTLTSAGGWHSATAADLFGPASEPAAHAAEVVQHLPSLTHGALFQVLVLGLAAAYLLLLYRNLTDVYALWGMTSIDRAKGNRILQTEGSNYTHFLNAMLALGIPVAGVAAVRLLALVLPPALAASVSPHLSAPLAGAAAAVLLLVAVLQVTALRLAGGVTLTQPFIGNLLHLKRIYAALAAVALSPPLLLWVLSPDGSGTWLSYLILGESAVLVILYLKETLALFISKKISILHWFLYLCLVEIFPVSLLWLLLVR